MACVSAVSGFREDGSEDEKEVLEIEVNEVLWRRLKRYSVSQLTVVNFFLQLVN